MVAIFWIDCSAIGYPFDEFYSRLIHEGKVGIMAGHVYGTEGGLPSSEPGLQSRKIIYGAYASCECN